MKALFKKREKWLESRGGRTEQDVEADELGDYVKMRDGANRKWYKVYLPALFQGLIVHTVDNENVYPVDNLVIT